MSPPRPCTSADVRDEFDPKRIVRGQQCDSARDEIYPGGRIAADERSPARASEPLGRLPCECSRSVVDGAQLELDTGTDCSRWYPTTSSYSVAPLPRRSFEPAAEALVQLGRASFGIDSYAASRMSRWRKRYVRSPRLIRSGRIRSLRTSAPSASATAGSCCRRARARATAPSWKTLPTTAARSITARSVLSSWSSRAASSAWIVGGTRIVAMSRACRPDAVFADEQAVVDQHREHLFDEERVAFGRLRRFSRRAHRPARRRRRGSGSAARTLRLRAARAARRLR